MPPFAAFATVYPRVCGGTAARAELAIVTEGLSPRVRGNRVGHSHAEAERRSIPACAGEPDWKAIGTSIMEVYPRVCGGTLDRRHPDMLLGGLSPRVRGNPPGSPRSKARTGSIPACAGEPSRHFA